MLDKKRVLKDGPSIVKDKETFLSQFGEMTAHLKGKKKFLGKF